MNLSEAERRTYTRYAGLALPRHTSYPIASVWSPRYGPSDFDADLKRLAHERRPLSLYVHIPFCERLCYYCACTKEIVPPPRHKEHDPAPAFLDALKIEAERIAARVGPGDVRQVHLGGGSPTFLSAAQLRSLWAILTTHFHVAPEAEIAVEVDPRITTFDQLRTLRELGFNRISLGVQDFDPAVQQAVNRVQPFAMVEECVLMCRSLGFTSVNFDLIYGLPFQTIESMAQTLEQTIRLGPDRIALFRLAVIPEIFRWQNVFRHTDLPAGDLSLDLNLLAINRLGEAGYRFIGLDHFAKPDEPLSQAERDGSLRRSFQGMTTGKDLDVVGLGPSAISLLDDAFAQNRKDTADWQQALAHDLATERGLHLSDDDRLRRELMQQLYGHGAIDKPALAAGFGIDFDDYFAPEMQRLRELMDEGLAIADANAIRLTAPLGRLLVRVVAAVFDAYLPPDAFRTGLDASLASKVG